MVAVEHQYDIQVTDEVLTAETSGNAGRQWSAVTGRSAGSELAG
ncbi:hypothetical protein V1634_05970 [Plantactinospora veratri]|uniref:Uncharacterized protein n=1 Tax=Plantactinospora veratri TaxID=1436122 RepID=A0ABU7S8V4_9ACTN